MTRKGFFRHAAWFSVGAVGWLLSGGALRATEFAGERETLLRRALRERRVVTFVYNSHRRWAEPHALGRVTDDQAALLVWQTDGTSESDPPPGWRTFLVAEINELELGADRFTRRPGYRPEGAGLRSVEVEVAASEND